MFIKAFEIFLQSLAYSFWPFIFVLTIVYLLNKYFNHGYKHKIETSFGDKRIGDIYNHETKD